MTNEQYQVVVGLLADIRDALVPPEPDPVEGCQHERAVSVATPGDPCHRICPDCKAHLGGSDREYRERPARKAPDAHGGLPALEDR